jgi:hypothetical protein
MVTILVLSVVRGRCTTDHACKIVNWLKDKLGFGYTDAIDKGRGAEVAAKIRALKRGNK